MADDNKLPSIDLDQLNAVTGGAGSDAFSQMLPMMMMMMMMRAREQPPVAAPVAPPPGDGWIRVA